MAGNVHHTVTENGSGKDTDGSYDGNCFEVGYLGSYCGVHEVDCVVADAYQQVEHCQHEQENDNS